MVHDDAPCHENPVLTLNNDWGLAIGLLLHWSRTMRWGRAIGIGLWRISGCRSISLILVHKPRCCIGLLLLLLLLLLILHIAVSLGEARLLGIS